METRVILRLLSNPKVLSKRLEKFHRATTQTRVGWVGDPGEIARGIQSRARGFLLVFVNRFTPLNTTKTTNDGSKQFARLYLYGADRFNCVFSSSIS